ncbi:FKBP-like protein [Ramaria rubella]|nr:FKBP-like protein [Ramaria rubella]
MLTNVTRKHPRDEADDDNHRKLELGRSSKKAKGKAPEINIPVTDIGDHRSILEIQQCASSPEVTFIDIVKGDGAEVNSGNTVTVNFTCTLLDGTTVSSCHEGMMMFTLGDSGGVKGWHKGMLGMLVRGRRLILIPPEFGYGHTKKSKSVPAGSFLLFGMRWIEFLLSESWAQ